MHIHADVCEEYPTQIIHMNICMCIFLYICMYIRIHAFMCIYVYVCIKYNHAYCMLVLQMYIYICVHTNSQDMNTNTHTNLQTFGKNIRQKLLQPPLKGSIVCGLDPGFKAGCKIAVVSETGKVS
jgi:hypothetical protein